MERLVCFGEILLRLNAPNYARFSRADSFEAIYAGSEANVSVLVNQLGVPASFVTKVPENDLGDAALQAVRALGVDTTYALQHGERLGLYFTEMGAGSRPSRVIYDRAGSAFANIKPGEVNWETALNGVSWFHWSGISAAVSQSAADVCAEAIAVAKKKNITVSVDFNYRSKLWKYGKKPSEVIPALIQQCDVINCDFDSLKLYFDIEVPKAPTKEDAFKQGCDSIRKKLPNVKAIAMSFRETTHTGSDLYTGAVNVNGSTSFSKAYTLGQIVDRIGSGDAFTGGLIYALSMKWEPSRVVQYATACGVLKHSMPGDFTILKKEEIESFLNQEIRGKIIR
jgi:2-dehydro-3-deoxygluconokinase